MQPLLLEPLNAMDEMDEMDPEDDNEQVALEEEDDLFLLDETAEPLDELE